MNPICFQSCPSSHIQSHKVSLRNLFHRQKFLPLTDTTRGWRRLRPSEPLKGSRKSQAGARKNCMRPYLTTTETVFITRFEASFNSVTPRRIHKAEGQTGMGVPCRCSKSGVRRSTGNTTASWIKCYGRKQTIGKGTAASKEGDNAQNTHRVSAPRSKAQQTFPSM